jgi:HAD superfamily hydrolase (TIGR01549 family)
VAGGRLQVRHISVTFSTVNSSDEIRAVTFDFFETLIHHRAGQGRGRSLSEYLVGCGYTSPPTWHDGALYRVFENHAAQYSPRLGDAERSRYRVHLAARVFAELGVGAGLDETSRHAEAIWDILGPPAFEVYPDVRPILDYLRGRGVGLAVISNWHCGLAHFVADLGLASYFDHVIGSADCGFAKPDPRIFARASTLLGESPVHILHVGDSYEADYQGGREAGFHVALLERGAEEHPQTESVVRRLADLRSVLG